MADLDLSLPIRTEADGDVGVKVVDSADPTRKLSINPDGSLNTTITGTDIDIRNLDSAQDSVTVVGTVNVGNTVQVQATDLDVRDLNSATDSVAADLRIGGQAVTENNPLPVQITIDKRGTEVLDFHTATVGANLSANHTYTVPAGKTLLISQIEATGSARVRIEVQVETAPGTFATRFVQFNSVAVNNMSIKLDSPLSVAAGMSVRIVRLNREKDPQDVYSTICGQLI